MKKKKTGLIIGLVIVTIVLVCAMPILFSLNFHTGSYPYSPEMKNPGISVDINSDTIHMRGFIAWNTLYNNIASSLWKPQEGISKSKLSVTTRDGVVINGYILEPAGKEHETLTTILYCHGGAFYMPIMPFSLDTAEHYVRTLNCRVIMPEYRLTPEYPYPTPINDCFDTLRYVAANKLTDTDKVIIYGESAGGCLAAEVVHMCVDEKLLVPMASMLIYPVADCGQHYESLTKYEYAPWSKASNFNMWKLYLDGKDPEELPYAVPMLIDDCTDFPPTYIELAEMDTLRDQAIAFADKMRNFGVQVTVNEIKGAYHGFDGDKNSLLVREALKARTDWLEDIQQTVE